MKLKLQFAGGLELVVGKGEVAAEFADASEMTIAKLLPWIDANVVKSKSQPFIVGDSVRPGILVLVNDGDWELFGGKDCVLQDGDTVTFITTLHGG